VLLERHLLAMKEVAGYREDQELVRVLSAASPRRVHSRLELTGLASADDSPDGWLYELASDFILSLTPRESPLILLKDAMYSIALTTFSSATIFSGRSTKRPLRSANRSRLLSSFGQPG